MFWLSKLSHCTFALLKMRFYRLGNLVLHQAEGIPIGGPISGVTLDVCLAYLERATTKTLWPGIQTQFGVQGSFDEYVATGRYVDDALLASRWLCDRCLFQLVVDTYGSEVAFENTSEIHEAGQHVAIKFLDFWIVLSSTGVSAMPHVRNEIAVWFSDNSMFEKTRFPPCSGHVGDLTSKLAADFQGKMARCRQLHCQGAAVQYFFLCVFFECLLRGYTTCILRQAWNKQRLHDRPYADGSRALVVIERLCAVTRPPFHKVVQEAFGQHAGLLAEDGVPLQLIAARVHKGVMESIPPEVFSVLRGLGFLWSLFCQTPAGQS